MSIKSTGEIIQNKIAGKIFKPKSDPEAKEKHISAEQRWEIRNDLGLYLDC